MDKETNSLLLRIIENQQKMIELNEKIVNALYLQYKIFSQYDTQYHEEIERSNEIAIPK